MRGVRAIKSRASSKSRFRLGQLPAVVGAPPVFTGDPEVYSGFWGTGTEPSLGWNVYRSAPGLTLQGYNGTWDDTDGETLVTGDFYDSIGTPLGGTPILIEDTLPGVEVELGPEHVGQYLTFAVVATRGGVSLQNTALVRIYVQATAPTPEVGSQSTDAPIYVAVNAPVSKPTYVWAAGAAVTPVVIEGEWYRNGVATGVTGDTFPDPLAADPLGQETAEGDIVRWHETCTNAADLTGTSPDSARSRTLISDLVPAVRAEAKAQVADRIDGLVGGATNMNVFSAVNHATSSFTFNEDNWCADLRYQLSAHYAGSSFNSARYGHFLITPRHILTCAHIGPIRDNRMVKFLTHDDRVVTARCKTSRMSKEIENGGADLQVILLDTDLSLENIPVVPILSLSAEYFHALTADTTGDVMPLVGVSQDGTNQTPGAYTGYGNPKSDYLASHQRMLHVCIAQRWYEGYVQFPSQYNGFHYAPYNGDSGGPVMLLAYDKLALLGILYSPNPLSNPVCYPPNRDAIANLIAAADADGVAQDFLDAPTGLLPTFIGIDELAAYPVPTPVQDKLLLLSEAEPVALLVSEADPTPILLPFHY